MDTQRRTIDIPYVTCMYVSSEHRRSHDDPGATVTIVYGSGTDRVYPTSTATAEVAAAVAEAVKAKAAKATVLYLCC